MDKTIIHGGNVRLSCNIGGDPNPSIEWLKDGKSISYHTEASRSVNQIGLFCVSSTDDSQFISQLGYLRRFKTECNYGVACLEVCGARLSDAGQYTCVVKNVDGQAATTCTVRVCLSEEDDKEYESIENGEC